MSSSIFQSNSNATFLRYPVGTQVRVYFNPAEPETAYLEPRSTLLRAALFLTAGTLLLAGALGVSLLLGPADRVQP